MFKDSPEGQTQYEPAAPEQLDSTGGVTNPTDIGVDAPVSPQVVAGLYPSGYGVEPIGEPAAPEPVAWITGGDCYADGHIDCYAWTTGEFTTPLYAAPVIPAGWVMVPQEPTAEMVEAGNDGFRNPDSRRHTVSSCYKAMISARPKGE